MAAAHAGGERCLGRRLPAPRSAGARAPLGRAVARSPSGRGGAPHERIHRGGRSLPSRTKGWLLAAFATIIEATRGYFRCARLPFAFWNFFACFTLRLAR